MCFVTSPQALPSSGIDERKGELKSYRFSDSKTRLTRSAPGIDGNMDPLFLRAFGFEGDVSVLEQFNVSETIPWSNYRPMMKPGEVFMRMRFSPSWRPIRGYGGYLSSLKIKWNGICSVKLDAWSYTSTPTLSKEYSARALMSVAEI